MLSAENAKLKSALDKTTSHMHRDIILKTKLSHTRGIKTSLNTNFIIWNRFPEGEESEFTADFKKSWFMVSQALVKEIRNKVKKIPSFILKGLLSPLRLRKQKILPPV